MTNELSQASVEYLHPETVRPMGRLATRLVNPLPWWIWCAVLPIVAIAIRWYCDHVCEPGAYYQWDIGESVVITIAVVIFIAIVVVRRIIRGVVAKHFGVTRLTPEWPRGVVALVLLIATMILIWSPLPMNIAFASQSAAFTSTLKRAANGSLPPGPFSIGPFRFTASEQYEPGIFILYTDGAKGRFPASGDGLIHLDKGKQFPGYRRGSEGPLGNGWYWFTTD